MVADQGGLLDLLNYPREFAVFIGGQLHGEIECVGESMQTYYVADYEDPVYSWQSLSPVAHVTVSRTVYDRKKFYYNGNVFSAMVADFVSEEAAKSQLIDWFGGAVDPDYSLRTNPTPKWVTEGKGKDFI